MPWYPFQVGGTDVSDTNQYDPSVTPPPVCPGDNNFLCALQANDNMGNPIITNALILEIANALQNRVDTTNVKLRPTK